ncbi:MAG: hypothetical protein M3308_02420, partial [Actinomycetota bacterium]|nr:hypothetical protein [Actinomycetota bacterium]
MIAAGALAVPMALGASGIAGAVENSSGPQNQAGTPEGDSSNVGTDDDILGLGVDGDGCDSEDESLGEGLRELFGVGTDDCPGEDVSGNQAAEDLRQGARDFREQSQGLGEGLRGGEVADENVPDGDSEG